MGGSLGATHPVVSCAGAGAPAPRQFVRLRELLRRRRLRRRRRRRRRPSSVDVRRPSADMRAGWSAEKMLERAMVTVLSVLVLRVCLPTDQNDPAP
ncbi:hypothetical protein GCM10009737_07000 [Nocardioides lentus]|uniref:Uncharacterized protein n=1 Tax=Nocardioides lentus TaxID=338077 RepID=A0ABN2P1Y6_9ACTN